MTYDDERERDLITSFIILLSFYLNEISLEEDSLEKRVSFEKTSFRAITLTLMKVTKKNESL